MEGTSNRGEDAGDGALRNQRAERFRRLMAAQEQIAEALTPYRVTDEQLDAALTAAEAALPRDPSDHCDFYRPALELYVGALGGRLELNTAVFPGVNLEIDLSH